MKNPPGWTDERTTEYVRMSAKEWNAQYMCAPVSNIDSRLRDAKPCPYCASRNLSLTRMGNFVHCETCGADGPDAMDRWNRNRLEDLRRLAVERWNLRLTPPTAKP